MCERVDPVDGGGYPRDEKRAEEEEGHPGVEPGVGVGFGEGVIAGQGAHAEEFGASVGGFALVVGFVLGTDFDVDGVGVEAGVVVVVVAFEARDAHFFVFIQGVLGSRRRGAGLPRFSVDGYFGGYGAKGIFVERIEEGPKCVAVAPDFAEGDAVDCKGRDEGDPVGY